MKQPAETARSSRHTGASSRPTTPHGRHPPRRPTAPAWAPRRASVRHSCTPTSAGTRPVTTGHLDAASTSGDARRAHAPHLFLRASTATRVRRHSGLPHHHPAMPTDAAEDTAEAHIDLLRSGLYCQRPRPSRGSSRTTRGGPSGMRGLTWQPSRRRRGRRRDRPSRATARAVFLRPRRRDMAHAAGVSLVAGTVRVPRHVSMRRPP